jgi:hypothetical protein
MKYRKEILRFIIMIGFLITACGSGICASCANLKQGFFGPAVTITSSALVPATEKTPEHCDIRGRILPEIGFAVKLPTDWNGRFYMVGNHGKGGDIDHEAIRVGLKKGYATAGTDMGHDSKKEPTGGYAYFAYHNREKEIDFGYRATHETAVTSKEIIKTFYGKPPAFSYFVGSSTGGRQGLMEAQRYPNDFNGILCGAAIVQYSCMQMAIAWYMQALLTPDSLGNGPVPLKNKVIAVEKLPILQKAVYEKCDGLDGLVDGVIQDPRQCNFNPEKDLPRCDADVDTPNCFTPPQMEALKKVYGGVISRGKVICPTLELGGETVWAARLIGTGTNRPVEYARNWDGFKYLLFEKDNPDYELLRDFNFESDPAKLNFMKRFLDADDPELFPFMQTGGKIILGHGWADSAHPPRMVINYYDSVIDFMGSKTDDFLKLYMIPGLLGYFPELEVVGSGPGPNSFDLFKPLVDWVEKGIPPERIIAAHMTDRKVDRTRPLCPYPKMAKYTGTGSIDDEANFTCAAP